MNMQNFLRQRPTKAALVENAKFFLLLNAGLVATALGIALFKTPNHFAFGGTSGLSIILSTLFPYFHFQKLFKQHRTTKPNTCLRISSHESL